MQRMLLLLMLLATPVHAATATLTLKHVPRVPVVNPIPAFTENGITITPSCAWTAWADVDCTTCGGVCSPCYNYFANEPGADYAMVTYSEDCTRWAYFDIVPPVYRASIRYSGSTYFDRGGFTFAGGLPITMRAQSCVGDNCTARGEVVGNEIGNSPEGAPCSGDPNGIFCHWPTMSLVSAQPFNRVVIQLTSGWPGPTYFGNLTVDTSDDATAARSASWGRVKAIYR